ncbi:MAG TPA: hypothetical protein VNI81_02170 [Candidatus Limnocylindrales bacterium]|nr:hypothetical protein [Candidatus Limnocylindrales bacterium]
MRSLLVKLVAFLIASSYWGSTFGQEAETPKEDRILFAVRGPQKGMTPEAFVLDPIARINGATLAAPVPEGKDRGAASSNFERIYFRPGATYPLFFGGSELGSITVEKAESISCESETATAKVSKPAPQGLDALAVTNLEGIRAHDNWRHVATEEQRTEFVSLAGDYLKSHGAETFTIDRLKIPSLRATRLKPGGPDVLIGNVVLVEKNKVHDLFLAIQFEPEKPQTLIASYHVSNDLEDGKDRQQEKFLDQIDLDGDGTDEIVTISGYYESWDYAIYREQNGEWKLAYKGGGGGC